MHERGGGVIWYFVFAFYPMLIAPALFGWLGKEAEDVATEVAPVVFVVFVVAVVIGMLILTVASCGR